MLKAGCCSVHLYTCDKILRHHKISLSNITGTGLNQKCQETHKSHVTLKGSIKISIYLNAQQLWIHNNLQRSCQNTS